MNMTISTINL